LYWINTNEHNRASSTSVYLIYTWLIVCAELDLAYSKGHIYYILLIYDIILLFWNFLYPFITHNCVGPSSLVVSITKDLVRALEWVFKRLRVQFPPNANILTLWPCGSNIIWQPLGFLVPIIGVYHRTSEHYCCQDARFSNKLPRGQDPWILQGQVVRLVLIVSTMSGDTCNWDWKDRSI